VFKSLGHIKSLWSAVPGHAGLSPGPGLRLLRVTFPDQGFRLDPAALTGAVAPAAALARHRVPRARAAAISRLERAQRAATVIHPLAL
jgi:hypothetical protein